MLTRALLPHRSSILKALSFRNAARSMSGHAVVHRGDMNNIPLPDVKYEDYYRKRQVGNNIVLLSGIAFFSLSFYFVYNSGVLYANWKPPKKNFEQKN